MIYHVVIRIIVHLNDLLCNYLIYYAISMISYTLNKFTIQLIDFVNNLLALVEGFNRYQIFGKKKVARGSRTRASVI